MSLINQAQRIQSDDSKADDLEAPCDQSSSESNTEGCDMSLINQAQRIQSDDVKADDSDAACYQSSSESYPKGYASYRRKDLPEDYTNYKGIRQVFEGVYDRYDSDYEEKGTHAQDEKLYSCNRKKRFCMKGETNQMNNRLSE